jgi:hypothetical protein
MVNTMLLLIAMMGASQAMAGMAPMCERTQHLDSCSSVDWTKSISEIFTLQEGCESYVIYYNLLGSPQMRISTTWKNIGAWSGFVAKGKWGEFLLDLRNNLAANVSIMIWRPTLKPGEPEDQSPKKPGEIYAAPVSRVEIEITFDVTQAAKKQ